MEVHMNAKSMGSAVAIVAIVAGVVAYAESAGREARVEAAMPTINQSSFVEPAIDNSRECRAGAPDVACVYL
jgi:hypothetical protein